ncbi:zeta toxin family protein [Rhodomicrobium lacus]|uniref:zeta toxin family protein n=1 Tax=Rhodomicrobium lacus TaxID=2498452 RepID=UPI0026E164E1|nr:zeta toxin family protein [Rhodomicrobium lacus]WKW50427.1 zeta toxin family protein [Rhodomicrobium lacus]
MTSRSYRLTAESHDEISRIMQDDMLAGSEPAEKPVLTLIGGQPGSLQAKLRAAAVEGLSPAPVIVSVAEARHFHPDAAALLARDERAFVQATDLDAQKWAETLALAAIEGRRNIMLDGFFRNQSVTRDVLQQACEAGYKTSVHVIALPEQISRARLLDIYEAGREKLGWGTLVPSPSHDEAVQTLANTLTLIEVRKLAPIRVFDRSGALLFSTEESRDAGTAFRRQIARPLEAADRSRLQTIERRIEAKMEARRASSIERRETQQLLRSARSRGMER